MHLLLVNEQSNSIWIIKLPQDRANWRARKTIFCHIEATVFYHWLRWICAMGKYNFSTFNNLKNAKWVLRRIEFWYVLDKNNVYSDILGLRPASEGRRYKVTPSAIGGAQTIISPDIRFQTVVRWVWNHTGTPDVILNYHRRTKLNLCQCELKLMPWCRGLHLLMSYTWISVSYYQPINNWNRMRRPKPWWCHQMETFFRVTGPLCGEFTGHRWIVLPKASAAELWCFLWSVPEQMLD